MKMLFEKKIKQKFLSVNLLLKSRFNLILLLILFFYCPFSSKAQNPLKCKVGIYVKTIKINQTDETFDVSFYWWLRVDSIDTKKDYSYVKNIEFINSTADNQVVEERVDIQGKYYYINGLCKGTFPYQSNFKKLPFDKQILNIALENSSANFDSLIYVPDNKFDFFNKKTDNSINILNGGLFSISMMNVFPSNYIYKTNFGDPSITGFDTYSRLNFKMEVIHNAFEVFQKIALPLFLVLVLSYMVFFIPDYEIGTAAGLTVTSLLAAIAFQWTIYDSLPKVSYITLMDKIFYLVYFFIFYAMCQTVITFNLSKGSKKSILISNRIELYSRYLFPVIFAISLYMLIISV